MTLEFCAEFQLHRQENDELVVDAKVRLENAAVAKTKAADTFRTATLENVTTAELFFRIPIGRYQGHITPSVQYVENPGFDGSGFGMPVSAVVSSLRLHWFW